MTTRLEIAKAQSQELNLALLIKVKEIFGLSGEEELPAQALLAIDLSLTALGKIINDEKLRRWTPASLERFMDQKVK